MFIYLSVNLITQRDRLMSFTTSPMYATCWSGDCHGMCVGCAGGGVGYVFPKYPDDTPPEMTDSEKYRLVCRVSDYERDLAALEEMQTISNRDEVEELFPETLGHARVIADYDTNVPGHIGSPSFPKLEEGDIIALTNMDDPEWWEGYISMTLSEERELMFGWFPQSFVEMIALGGVSDPKGSIPSAARCAYLHSVERLEGNIECDNGYYYNADIVNKQREMSDSDVWRYQSKFSSFKEEMDTLMGNYNYKSPEEPGDISKELELTDGVYSLIQETGGQACDDPECCMVLHCMQTKEGYWDDGGIVDYYQRLPIYTKERKHELCALCIANKQY